MGRMSRLKSMAVGFARTVFVSPRSPHGAPPHRMKPPRNSPRNRSVFIRISCPDVTARIKVDPLVYRRDAHPRKRLRTFSVMRDVGSSQSKALGYMIDPAEKTA